MYHHLAFNSIMPFQWLHEQITLQIVQIDYKIQIVTDNTSAFPYDRHRLEWCKMWLCQLKIAKLMVKVEDVKRKWREGY